MQGCPLNTEYVTEFTISYGSNGLDYADFLDPGGTIKVTLNGNLVDLFCDSFESKMFPDVQGK